MDRIRRRILKTGAGAAAMAAAPQLFAGQSRQQGAARVYEKGRVRISYEEAGAGFPLLLIAGGGLNSTMARLATSPFRRDSGKSRQSSGQRLPPGAQLLTELERVRSNDRPNQPIAPEIKGLLPPTRVAPHSFDLTWPVNGLVRSLWICFLHLIEAAAASSIPSRAAYV